MTILKRFAGLLLLAAVILAVAFLVPRAKKEGASGGGTTATTTATVTADLIPVKGLIGSEKAALINDPDVVRVLRERYHLEVEADKRGSLEMVEGVQPPDRDFLWPSSQVALDLFRTEGHAMVGSDVLLNSPIVLYSWGPVTDALLKRGIVQKKGETYYVVDFPRLIQTVQSGAQWKDLGLPQLYGKVVIYSTDPVLSNSGSMFSGLLANVLSGKQVATEESLPKVLPIVKRLFDDQGYMEESSETIFRQFLNKGMGDKPLIVGYEAQQVEAVLEADPRLKSRVAEVRLLYPQPTVWSSHPMIALTPNGAKLLEALKDTEIQEIAWRKHGFRSAVGAENDTKALGVPGIPSTIENIIAMPRSKVMTKIREALK